MTFVLKISLLRITVLNNEIDSREIEIVFITKCLVKVALLKTLSLCCIICLLPVNKMNKA